MLTFERTNERRLDGTVEISYARGLALVVVSASTWVLWSMGTNSQPTPTNQLPSVVNSPPPVVPTNPVPQNPQPASNTQPIANAANIPPDQSLIYNDPTLGPVILIHLDNGQFVAFSAICTHAGCQVQFDPSLKDIVCPCHGAVYDPYHNAQVIAGPAPYPLQKVPIQYSPTSGNIYLTG